MMRVLHVHSGNIYGGIETLLVTLARYRHLCPEMETSYALSFAGRLSEELAAAGSPVYELGNARLRQPSTVIKARRALKRLLARERFDIIICHSAWSLVVFGPAIRPFARPLAFWLHATDDGKHWLERWARRTRPELVICNSEFTAARRHLIYPQTQAEMIYCPVAAPDLNYSSGDREAARAEFDTPENAVVIIQIARLEKYKGHRVLLESLSLLGDARDWVYWQVGGPQRPDEVRYLGELKDAAERLGIAGRVRFLGWQPDALKLLAAADIYCQPNTVAEPFGITFIESLYARRPVVTTNMGGPKEIIDDSCGMLVPPGDAGALAVVLRRMIEDSALRARMGEAGPARARHLCDPSKQIRRLYQTLAGISENGCREKVNQGFYPA
jgi:glycosyltransferase involved in cell wall biosynthesis